MQGEADFGKAREDDAKDRAGILLGLETGVGAELIGGIPESPFEGALCGVLSEGAIKCISRFLDHD
jgi:hypothetical protein